MLTPASDINGARGDYMMDNADANEGKGDFEQLLIDDNPTEL